MYLMKHKLNFSPIQIPSSLILKMPPAFPEHKRAMVFSEALEVAHVSKGPQIRLH